MTYEPDYEDIHIRNMEAREMDRQEPHVHVPVTKEPTWRIKDRNDAQGNRMTCLSLRTAAGEEILLQRVEGTAADPNQSCFIPANLESAELLSDLLD